MEMKKKIDKISAQFKIEKLKDNQQAIAFFVCILIATSLWFLNALSKDYTTTITYPVKYVNAPNKQFLANEPPAKLELKVDAHGFTLLRHKLSFSFSPIILNLSNITRNIEHHSGFYQVASATLLRRIRSQVSNEISITEVHPDIIPILLDSLKTKTVPVETNINISFKPQFNLKNPVSIKPDVVKVTGPSTIIDTIEVLYTEERNFDELDGLTEKNLEILHPEKTTLSPGEVTLRIDIEKFTEKEIWIPIEVQNKPGGTKIKLFPSGIKLNCLVGLSEFENITANDFKASVDYKTVSQNTNKLTVTLEKKPSYIEVIRHSPEAVEYLIETN